MTHLHPIFVDAHCHLDLYPDMEALMAQCDAEGVQTITVTTTPRAWPRNRDVAGQFRFIEPALGLHPQLVGQFSSELNIWDSYLSEARVIGEVGLDAGPKFYKTLDLQKEVFTHVLQSCAKEGDKVISVHSVRAARMVLDLVEAHLPDTGCTVILHWFTGTLSEAKRAVELGCYLSVNMEMIRSPIHFETLRSLPLKRILTETDGPFTKIGDLPCVPSSVRYTVQKLADVLCVDAQELRLSIVNNYAQIFER